MNGQTSRQAAIAASAVGCGVGTTAARRGVLRHPDRARGPTTR
jgi:hypothetical protein